MRAAAERHLGGPLEAATDADWSVQGTITHAAGDGYRLSLVVVTGDGRIERPLQEPSDCRALSDSAALLIALAFDPEALDGTDPAPAGDDPADVTPPTPPTPQKVEPNDPPEQPEPPPPEPEPPRDDVEAVEPAPVEATGEGPPAPTRPRRPRRPRPLEFSIGAMSGLDWGTLRGVTPRGRIAFSWQLPRLRVGVAAIYGANPRFELPPISAAIGLQVWTVAAEVGPVLHAGRFEFPLLAGIEAGQIIIVPRELLDPSRAQVAWAALLVTPGAAWVVRPWLAITARVGATVSFVRPSFTVPGLRQIHAPAPAGVRASLGVEFRFPLVMKGAAAGN